MSTIIFYHTQHYSMYKTWANCQIVYLLVRASRLVPRDSKCCFLSIQVKKLEASGGFLKYECDLCQRSELSYGKMVRISENQQNFHF